MQLVQAAFLDGGDGEVAQDAGDDFLAQAHVVLIPRPAPLFPVPGDVNDVEAGVEKAEASFVHADAGGPAAEFADALGKKTKQHRGPRVGFEDVADGVVFEAHAEIRRHREAR